MRGAVLVDLLIEASEIRDELTWWYIPERHADCRVAAEKALGQWSKCFADVLVMEPDQLHVYEIKSERDSPSRLKKQLYEYVTYAHAVTLVIGEKLLKRIERALPKACDHAECKVEEVGLVVAKRVNWWIELETLRPATPWGYTGAMMLMSLHQTELRAHPLCRAAKLNRKYACVEYLDKVLTPDQASRFLCETMRERLASGFRSGGNPVDDPIIAQKAQQGGLFTIADIHCKH